MLADIFIEDEPAPEMPVHFAEGPFAGLDTEHTKLLTKLVSSAEWTRLDFETVATEVGLMPDGAMEAINEWAFDKYGDALLEDGNPVAVNLALMSQDLAKIAATHAHSGPAEAGLH
jgi:hypothetical protein